MCNESWACLIEERIPSQKGAGEDLQSRMLEALEALDWLDHDIFGIRLAFEEAIVNAMKHGNGHDKQKWVRVVCKLSNDRIRIEITDEGSGFEFDSVPDPTDEERLEVPNGRGIMLMRAFMCRVEYNDAGNRVVMEKQRGASSDP